MAATDTVLVTNLFEQKSAPTLVVTPTGGAQTTLGAWMALPITSVTNGITAFAGGGQGSAVALVSSINRVTVVASAADSVKLMAAVPGLEVTVINAAASNAMNLFPATGDAINALSANTAFSIVAGKTALLVCAVAGTWHLVLSA
jgi:hypothetical protein